MDLLSIFVISNISCRILQSSHPGMSWKPELIVVSCCGNVWGSVQQRNLQIQLGMTKLHHNSESVGRLLRPFKKTLFKTLCIWFVQLHILLWYALVLASKTSPVGKSWTTKLVRYFRLLFTRSLSLLSLKERQIKTFESHLNRSESNCGPTPASHHLSSPWQTDRWKWAVHLSVSFDLTPNRVPTQTVWAKLFQKFWEFGSFKSTNRWACPNTHTHRLLNLLPALRLSLTSCNIVVINSPMIVHVVHSYPLFNSSETEALLASLGHYCK